MNELLINIVLGFIGVGIGLLVNFLAEVLPRKYRRSFPMETTKPPIQYKSNYKKFRSILVLIIYAILTIIIWYLTVNILDYFLTLSMYKYLGLIFIIDLENRVILNSMIVIGVVFSAIFGINQNGMESTILGGTVGFIVFVVLFYFGKFLMTNLAKLRHIDLEKQALSKNDVLLGLILGLILGWSEIINGLLIVFFLMGIAGSLIIFYMIEKRNYNPNLSIPIGPFIVLGAVIASLIDIKF